MRPTLLAGAILFCAALVWLAGAQSKGNSGGTRLIDSIKGPALYQAYCASCHGIDATGKGPMANSLKVAPADLTRISARNGGMFPLPRVSRIISGEEALPAGHGNRAMPVWGPVFSQVDADQDLGRIRIDNLARYLRDIQKP
jgi:mono/diheme cytochrome c family protein